MSTSATISLQHLVRRHGNQMVFFYDGALEAKDGLLTLPVDRIDWIKRAMVSGYRITPDGRTLYLWPEVEAEIARQSTKSTGDKVEDSDAGRQPKAKDRIRES